jgi:hypothetical protein
MAHGGTTLPFTLLSILHDDILSSKEDRKVPHNITGENREYLHIYETFGEVSYRSACDVTYLGNTNSTHSKSYSSFTRIGVRSGLLSLLRASANLQHSLFLKIPNFMYQSIRDHQIHHQLF